MTMNVVETAWNDGYIGFTALGDSKRDSRGAGFQFRQLRLGMTDTFGKYSHTVSRLYHFI